MVMLVRMLLNLVTKTRKIDGPLSRSALQEKAPLWLRLTPSQQLFVTRS